MIEWELNIRLSLEEKHYLKVMAIYYKTKYASMLTLYLKLTYSHFNQKHIWLI
jgi:hypothetical protein